MDISTRGISMNESGNIKMRVAGRSEEIDWSCWESIRDNNNLLTDPAYLKAVEESGVLECEYRYFEFYERGQLMCSMFGYVILNDAALFYGERSKKLISAVRRIIPGFLTAKTLEIGTPVSVGITVSISPQVKREQIFSIVDLLKEYTRKNHIKVILIRDFKEGKTSLESVLSESGFKCIPNLADSVMKIEWGSFEEYLSSLKSRYRHHARMRMRKKEVKGVRTVFTNGSNALEKAGDYARLFRNVMDRSEEYEREFIGEQYHAAMSDNLKGCNYWLQYLKGDNMAAFAHFIVYKDSMIIQYVGMDYDISHEALLYFNSFYDQIRFAIDKGIKSIEAGITTYRTKSELGFSIYPQRMYIWHKCPFVRPFIGLVFKATEHRLDDCHYAFKDNRHQYLWDGKDMFAGNQLVENKNA